ncbi:hypothetical protein [Nocardia sp. CS682]|uniref:variant leucine-rich repeat-containing protein n=1 Tax=Nocardia sp. CS682 TaxID=1047172 RepID=UPI001074A8A8|nr:hypothetical protein [Nocardia sp. CS682]QBS40225.1 hypothetical protein DMB37_08925 [Nocardia sp. CS682]
MHDQTSIRLMPGETLRLSTQFSPHLILSHLKVGLVVTDRRVVVHRPNTIFAVIPRGSLEQATPLGKVSEIAVGEAVSTRHLVFGAGSLLVALLSLFSAPATSGVAGFVLGLVLLGVSAYLFSTARQFGIWVRNQGGGVLRAPAGHHERRLVNAARNCLETLIFGNGPAGSASATTDYDVPAPTTPGTITPSTQRSHTGHTPSRPQAPRAAANAPTSPVGYAAPNPQSSYTEYVAGNSALDARPDGARAADPLTAPAALYEIAQRWPQLRARVAANPAADPDLLSWLSELGDPEVDRVLAGRK